MTDENGRPTAPLRASAVLTLMALLALATAFVYAPTLDFDFVSIDDNRIVYENSHVLGGLTSFSARWALTSAYHCNWHPLTWLSHMLDGELFGMRAGAHHATNVALHIANTLLLFALLARLTRAMWRSAFVAAAFALHPLHVESVAWVSERKDVLSGFFWLLTLWCYASWTDTRSRGRWLLVVGCTAAALMSKPMAVTLPFTLLLFDYWPLRRIRDADWARPASWRPLLIEKLPLFGLAGLTAVATLLAQRGGNCLVPEAAPPLWFRIENALVSYVTYLVKSLWPDSLVVLVPFPASIPAWQSLGALICLAGITVWLIRTPRIRPALMGWLWYLGTLAPVIGLIQVGEQARADRYTYIPLIGWLIAVTWGLQKISERLRIRVALPALLGVLATAAMIGLARPQVETWRNSEALLTHGLEAFPDSPKLLNNRAGIHTRRREYESAERLLRHALEIAPDMASAQYNLGVVLKAQGKREEARQHFERALQLDPEQRQSRRALRKFDQAK